MLTLPEALEEIFLEELKAYEKEKNMPCHADNDTLLQRVEELKPHFDPTEIKSGLNELVCLKYLVDDAFIN